IYLAHSPCAHRTDHFVRPQPHPRGKGGHNRSNYIADSDTHAHFFCFVFGWPDPLNSTKFQLRGLISVRQGNAQIRLQRPAAVCSKTKRKAPRLPSWSKSGCFFQHASREDELEGRVTFKSSTSKAGRNNGRLLKSGSLKLQERDNQKGECYEYYH